MSQARRICFIHDRLQWTVELNGELTIADIFKQVIVELNLPKTLPPEAYTFHAESAVEILSHATCNDFDSEHVKLFVNHDINYSQVEYIKQKHSHGCAVACLAMVTGKAYDYVREYFSGIDFNKTGITWYEYNEFLLDHGYAMNWQYVCTQAKGTNREREEWPPILWSPLHIVIVATLQGSHAIVMKKNGKIFDPICSTRETLDDFLQITQVIGVYKI